MFKKINKTEQHELITIYLYNCTFKTTDNEIHTSSVYNYIDKEAIRCTPQEYYMIDIKHNNYIIGDNGRFYPLNNIIWIEWKCIDSIENVYPEKYQVFYEKNAKRLDK